MNSTVSSQSNSTSNEVPNDQTLNINDCLATVTLDDTTMEDDSEFVLPETSSRPTVPSVRQSHYVEGAHIPLGTPSTVSSISTANNGGLGNTVSPISIDEKIKLAEQTVIDCDVRIADLERQQIELLSMTVLTTEDLNRRELTLGRLNSELTTWSNMSNRTMERLSVWKKTSVIDSATNAKLLSLNTVTHIIKDHSKIPTKELPVFNVKPSSYIPIGESSQVDASPSMSLDTFIRRFERVYTNHDVNVNEHWFFHLEACFEKDDLNHTWFQQVVKPNYIRNKSEYTWKHAKQVMKQRYDFSHGNGISASNIRLINMRQSKTDTLSVYLDKIMCMAIDIDNINDLKKNYFFTLFFISSLHTSEFQSKVKAKLADFMKTRIRNSPDTTMHSVTSTDDDDRLFSEFYADFSRTLEAIRCHLTSLEEELISIRQRSNEPKKGQTEQVSSSNSNNYDSKKASYKKRKIETSSDSKPSNYANINFQKLEDVRHVLNSDERQHLLTLKKCLWCRTAQFTEQHSLNCKHRSNKKVSSKDTDVKILSNEIHHPLQDDTDSSIPNSVQSNLSEEEDDEYQAALNDIDNFIINDNYELDHLDNNKYIFAIQKDIYLNNVTMSKRGTIGDDENNPFNHTDNAAYSPITPAIVNNKRTYFTLDSGAQVSVLNKKFAIDNGIKFHKIDGSLVLANGSKIPREQTVDFVKIDYDGVNKTILHKFDVIDNELLTNSSQILVGMDLMPKLSIHLVNVAHKYKDTTEVTANADENQAYVPNVTPYGSEKEQLAFSKALEPYINANKALDKTTLCNLPESVLYLPTPKGYSVNVRQYPIAYQLKPKVMAVINKWLKEGIIVRAEPSEWNLPITVRIKKSHDTGTVLSKTDANAEVRVVLDTRLLNKALPTINETLPLISDIFQSMSEGIVFSTIDLASAFSQFKVNESDRIKTSFTGPDNIKYMHVGSPFGVSTISQLFSRVILTLFKDLPYVKSFVDDIVIMSRSMNAHFHHVKTVLTILTKANLRINFEKSHFAKAEVYLLGYVISANGRRIDTRKLTNLASLEHPTTSKQCQSFLGFVNYFRQHIPNAALLMSPMDALRSHDEKNKGKPFKWNAELDMHFNALKQILQSDLVLSHPDLTHPFRIATDSSDHAVGCVLYQEYTVTDANNNTRTIIKHIGFFSRKLSDSESRGSCTMRELIGCIYALTQFHKFIWGTHFTLYTDHKALSYIFTQKMANSMMMRWLDILLSYDFSVVYLKGMDNVLPDALSRLYPPRNDNEEERSTKTNRHRSLQSLKANHVLSDKINKLKSDRSIKFVRQLTVESLGTSTRSTDGGCTSNTPIINDDDRYIFYIQSGQTIHSDYLIAPESERKALLEDAHNKVGHYGAEQMVKRLHYHEGIHWPRLIDDCIEFIRKCVECQKHNIAKRGYHPLRPIYAYLPGDHYAIDLGCPTNLASKLGNNYFLVVVCVTTRFCILRPLKDKKSSTVLTELVSIFSLLGFPSVLQSDNGKEFKNSLATELADAMGFDHRFITPMHASANGLSERYVQSVKQLLSKGTKGIGNDWDLHINGVQLALNNRISKKLNSTPFSLFFARRMIEPYGFRTENRKSLAPEKRTPMSHEELMKRIDYMCEIVFPAIHDKAMDQIELDKARFDSTHIMANFPPGSHVMVRLQNKAGQLSPAYTGPYTVVRKTQGNSYVLRDHTGQLMPRNYTSIELKLISQDEVIELDDEGNEIKHYELEAILDHRGEPTKREYLVRFKNHSSDMDEWIAHDQFNATEMLRNYWKKLGISYKPKKSTVQTKPTTAIQALKNNPPGSVTALMDSLSDNSDASFTSSMLQESHKRTHTKSSSSRKQSNKITKHTNVPLTKFTAQKRKNENSIVGTRKTKRQAQPKRDSAYIYTQ